MMTGSNHAIAFFFMDDAAVMATSREALQQKLLVLEATAAWSGLTIHPNKSHCLSMSNTHDRVDLTLKDALIKPVTEYRYLGCLITVSKLPIQIEHEIKDRQKQCLKFIAFINQNEDAPLEIKQKVWIAAMQSSILYGYKSWFCSTDKWIQPIFFKCIKHLLGVRPQTYNILCCIESGLPNINDVIIERQKAFLRKSHQSPSFNFLPIAFALRTIEQTNSTARTYITELPTKPVQYYQAMVKHKALSTDSTRFRNYIHINPTAVHHQTALYTWKVQNCIYSPTSLITPP